MRESTLRQRRRTYLLARVAIERHYREALTLKRVARALGSSPRQLQRVFVQFGDSSFHEDLVATRMRAAAELLAGQAIPVRDVARLVGYRQTSHFAGAFAERYGVSPASFRVRARARAARERSSRRSEGSGGSGANP